MKKIFPGSSALKARCTSVLCKPVPPYLDWTVSAYNLDSSLLYCNWGVAYPVTFCCREWMRMHLRGLTDSQTYHCTHVINVTECSSQYPTSDITVSLILILNHSSVQRRAVISDPTLKVRPCYTIYTVTGSTLLTSQVYTPHFRGVSRQNVKWTHWL